MIKISAVIITFNEEKNIERCIESLLPVSDEIIVLDSFSTDKTKEIALRYGVKFYEKKFEGYNEQKNFAIRKTEFDYVLSLDADECLTLDLQNSILKVKQNAEFDAYYLNRLNFFCQKKIEHTGWYPDKKIRFWNKNIGRWDGNVLHEKVVMQENSKISQLEGDLLHYTFTSINQHIAQINKFSEIKAQVAFEAGKKTSILKMIFLPAVKFLTIYILKLGFLDGFYGFVISINSAHSNFLKHAKLFEICRKNRRNINLNNS